MQERTLADARMVVPRETPSQRRRHTLRTCAELFFKQA